MNRRRFLQAAGGAAAAGLGVLGYGRFIEPGWVRFTAHALPPGRGGTAPIRCVAQISDLHLQGIGEQHAEIAEVIAGRSPDMILITGDSVDSAGALPILGDFLSLLPYGISKYAILGNWEHWAGVDVDRLAVVYERANGALLVNRSVQHTTSDGRVRVTGLDDLVGGRPNPAAALEGARESDLHVLLAHCPAQRDLLGSGRETIDLVLSGHTHGGQVQVLGRAPWIPPGSGRYVEGWYREGGPPMYVSRGVGTSGVPVRFGVPPEVAFFERAGGSDA